MQMALSQPNQISYLRRNEPENLNALMTAIIATACRSFNVNQNMDGGQIAELISIIYSDYWMLKPEEILVIFKNAKMGRYGRVEYSLDIAKICSWFDKYIDAERIPYFEEKNKVLKPEKVSQEFVDYYEKLKEEKGASIREHWKSMEESKVDPEEKAFNDFQQAYFNSKNK